MPQIVVFSCEYFQYVCDIICIYNTYIYIYKYIYIYIYIYIICMYELYMCLNKCQIKVNVKCQINTVNEDARGVFF